MYDAYAVDGLDLLNEELAAVDADLEAFEIGGLPRRRAIQRRRRRRMPPPPPRRRRRGFRNIDLLDDDETLMGFMGITEDDLDFVESVGSSVEVYGQTPVRTFFTERVPELVEKFKQKAQLARIKAQQLENRADRAVLRARELQARAQAGEPLIPSQQPKKTLTTPQVLGIAALAVGVGYLVAKKL